MEIVQPEGTGGGSGTTLEYEVPAGTVDDSNTIFTVMNTPLYINVNGSAYTVGNGTFQSYSLGVITLSSPVGLGGFILSFYNS